jgi:hypothetical protein
MALRGRLQDFTFVQILNLVNLAHKTGCLIVEKPVEKARVFFREGKLVYAILGNEPEELANILNKARILSDNQARVVIQHNNEFSDKALGLMLINSGLVSREVILSTLQIHYLDIIRQLFTWIEGAFVFENDTLPPADRISIRLELENIILEGSRQMQEWESLKDEIPSLEMALKFTEAPRDKLKNIHLTVEEWRVISYVNPRNTMRQIAGATRMNELEFRRIVLGLLQAGLVDIVRPGKLPVEGVPQVIAPVKKEEKRSLVQRLIERIRTL